MDIAQSFSAALVLIWGGDPAFVAIVRLSLAVTLTAVAVAALIGLPVGALLALSRFSGRGLVIVLINALMGLPPVVAGLLVFLLLSRSVPLGPLGLLFTPTAMVVAQAILVLPIVIAITRLLRRPARCALPSRLPWRFSALAASSRGIWGAWLHRGNG